VVLRKDGDDPKKGYGNKKAMDERDGGSETSRKEEGKVCERAGKDEGRGRERRLPKNERGRGEKEVKKKNVEAGGGRKSPERSLLGRKGFL